ncbi:sulfite exporter TauE/SafE family protein [Paractinoplanes globisporus]|uniref:Probable membrane transporter protein n=1 Tax=Paractinoplanes globisporus TaxID=113565 RepID=A0ABW6W857_9ACTN|nr:sulfite exporter TauE/SafE family protein [Actinoplanes globisporus]
MIITWEAAVLALGAGLMIATVTTPVGVSGAVFLLPVQLSVLHVPSPAVTPTNLLFNVVAGPGGLLRFRAQGGLAGPLTRMLLIGTLPGVVLGAVIRVFAVPGPRVFRLIVAIVLLPLGLWLCVRALWPAPPSTTGRPLPGRAIIALAVAAGTIGGIYGIGGGSLLGPILAGRGVPITQLAPAVLASTFLTSIAGAATYVVLAATTSGTIAPDWALGLLSGLGGLIGGYVGARLQPHLPERVLRLLLGVLATALATLYAVQAATF